MVGEYGGWRAFRDLAAGVHHNATITERSNGVHDVFDETAKVNGDTGLADHRESTYTFTNGTVTGTACNLGLAFGTIVVTSCVDSLKGDCTADQPQFGSSPAPTGFGPPASVNGGHVTWAWNYVLNGDAKVTEKLTVDVSNAP